MITQIKVKTSKVRISDVTVMYHQNVLHRSWILKLLTWIGDSIINGITPVGLTHSFPMHPFSTPEIIRKQKILDWLFNIKCWQCSCNSTNKNQQEQKLVEMVKGLPTTINHFFKEDKSANTNKQALTENNYPLDNTN